jgi:hypothetical protein
MPRNPYSNKTFQQLIENNPTGPLVERQLAHCLTLYLHEGRQMIFYYLYLVKVEFLLQDPLNALILRFTSDKVTLEGYRLHGLFLEFAQGKPDSIVVQDERYVTAGMVGGPAVINASVEPTDR